MSEQGSQRCSDLSILSLEKSKDECTAASKLGSIHFRERTPSWGSVEKAQIIDWNTTTGHDSDVSSLQRSNHLFGRELGCEAQRREGELLREADILQKCSCFIS